MTISLKLDGAAHRSDPKCLAECPIDEEAAEAHLSLEFSHEPGPQLIVRGWGPTYEIQAENAKAWAEQIARMLKTHSELLFAVHRCAHWLAHMDILALPESGRELRDSPGPQLGSGSHGRNCPAKPVT